MLQWIKRYLIYQEIEPINQYLHFQHRYPHNILEIESPKYLHIKKIINYVLFIKNLNIVLVDKKKKVVNC